MAFFASTMAIIVFMTSFLLCSTFSSACTTCDVSPPSPNPPLSDMTPSPTPSFPEISPSTKPFCPPETLTPTSSPIESPSSTISPPSPILPCIGLLCPPDILSPTNDAPSPTPNASESPFCPPETLTPTSLPTESPSSTISPPSPILPCIGLLCPPDILSPTTDAPSPTPNASESPYCPPETLSPIDSPIASPPSITIPPFSESPQSSISPSTIPFCSPSSIPPSTEAPAATAIPTSSMFIPPSLEIPPLGPTIPHTPGPISSSPSPSPSLAPSYLATPPSPVPIFPPSSPFSAPSPSLMCPRDTLKLGVCMNLLEGVIGAVIGTPTSSNCCSLLTGLTDLEAALCLCTAINANVLGVNLNIPITFSLIISACEKEVPSGFKCG